MPESAAPFDLDTLLALERVQSVTVSPNGRIVAAVARSTEDESRLTSALWELGEHTEPRRLTFSTKGESAPRFCADGSLLFSSARPDPQNSDGPEGVPAIWRLPERGEASVVASAAGGLSVLDVATDGTILAATSVLPGASLAEDAERREQRTTRKETGIWHTGMPIRYWDHEVGDVSPRLVLIRPGDQPIDLTPRADTLNLLNATACLTPDGAVLTTWRTRAPRGETRTALVQICTETGRRTTLLKASGKHSWHAPTVSPDGTQLAVLRSTTATPSDTSYDFLEIHAMASLTGESDIPEPVVVDVEDLTISEFRWTSDGSLLIAGDLHSSGAVLVADPTTGGCRPIADEAVYSSLAPDWDGRSVTVLASDIATPPTVRRLNVRRRHAPTPIESPGAAPKLPGKLQWVETDLDGVAIGGWLCVPTSASTTRPAPVMLWIHGGPHASYNSWSWRWCPWLAVARGYAVLMPDPAMSTGYGHRGLNRGWPRLADVVWRECETLLDHVLHRRTLDRSRLALLGASFGGFMTNWLAGHTDRFRCIVTHAGLWALDQQHPTTDAAAGKVRVHGDPDEFDSWYRGYSPHHSRRAISTPMLITHGNCDYRVPVSEALRLWWDLVSGWAGSAASMPHRFLQFTDENHWVLRPSNSRIWNETVLAFCDQHVRDGDPVPDVLPWG